MKLKTLITVTVMTMTSIASANSSSSSQGQETLRLQDEIVTMACANAGNNTALAAKCNLILAQSDLQIRSMAVASGLTRKLAETKRNSTEQVRTDTSCSSINHSTSKFSCKIVETTGDSLSNCTSILKASVSVSEKGDLIIKEMKEIQNVCAG